MRAIALVAIASVAIVVLMTGSAFAITGNWVTDHEHPFVGLVCNEASLCDRPAGCRRVSVDLHARSADALAAIAGEETGPLPGLSA